jgi:hypothetical protein
VEPLGEKDIEFGVPHIGRVKGEIIFTEAVVGHRPYPEVPAIIVPRPPVALKHGCAGDYLKGNTYTIDFQYIRIGLQCPVDIIYRFVVLNLIVHAENTDLSFQLVLSYIFYAKIKHNAAILSSGKRHIYIVKFIKKQFDPL